MKLSKVFTPKLWGNALKDYKAETLLKVFTQKIWGNVNEIKDYLMKAVFYKETIETIHTETLSKCY